MFGLFKKKAKSQGSAPASERAPSAQPTAAEPALGKEAQAWLARWASERQAIAARFGAVLDEAVHASRSLMDSATTDMIPLTQAWGAVEHQLHQARSAVDEAWDRALDELDELDVPHEVSERAGAERDIAGGELEIAYWTAYRQAMAAATQPLLERALAMDAGGHPCANCGATLDSVRPVSASLNVACAYCGGVNSIHPGPALRAFAASGAAFIAEAHALPAWQRLRRAELAIDSYRNTKDVPMALLEAFDAAAKDYWSTRFGVEAELVPEQRPYVAGKVEANLKTTGKKLRQHWQWRERHPV